MPFNARKISIWIHFNNSKIILSHLNSRFGFSHKITHHYIPVETLLGNKSKNMYNLASLNSIGISIIKNS